MLESASQRGWVTAHPARTPATLLAAFLMCAPVQADGPVLHEYLDAVDPHEATLQLIRTRGDGAPIIYDGEVLKAPDLEDARPVPVMTGRRGDGVGGEDAGQRAPSFRPDRLTELEGQLSYFSAFNPVVAPFKRVTSLDAVVIASDGVTPVLTVAASERAEVGVLTPDAPAPDGRPRDRFWGEVELDFRHGRAVPLPSVAPNARILRVQTRPDLPIAIERDAADNFFAVVRGPRPAGRVRMAFLTDAPQTYFGTRVPDAPVAALARHVPPMPAALRARALRFAGELGLGNDSDLRTAIHTLTRHFRSFEESAEPPDDTGDIYLDLARGMRGICRHRTYAFVITAQALGIPTRFVQNEAHSFVEVELPQVGFMRIDLGGAAQGVTAHGAQDRPRYRPAEPDRLPRPAAYERSYSQAAQGVSGLRPELSSQPQGDYLTPEGPLPERAGENESASADGATAPSTEVQAGGTEGEPGEAATAVAAAERAAREPMQLRLFTARTAAQRGQTLRVRGALSDARGRGRPGMRVEVSLAAATDDARLLLGVTVTDAEGGFDAELGLPADLPLGDYRMVVVAPGDERYLPATAR